MRIWVIGTCIAIALGAGSVIGIFWYQSSTNETEIEQTTSEETEKETSKNNPSEIQSNPSEESEFPLTNDGEIDITKLDKNGPWNRDLLLFSSTNGTTWENEDVFVEAAGVPSITSMENGTLVAAFQWFPVESPENFDKVAISMSQDGGKTWSDPIPATFEDLPNEYQRPFDPTVVRAEDGTIRMFFTSSPSENKIFNDTVAIYSATSEDGLTYTFESGTRLDSEGVANFDSAAALFNNTWYLSTPKNIPGESTGGTYLATSTDGINFEEQEGYEETNGYNWTGNLVIMNELLTFFGTASPGNIWYTQSSNGVSWSEKTLTNVRGGDPAVIQTEEGTWIMIAVE